MSIKIIILLIWLFIKINFYNTTPRKLNNCKWLFTLLAKVDDIFSNMMQFQMCYKFYFKFNYYKVYKGKIWQEFYTSKYMQMNLGENKKTFNIQNISFLKRSGYLKFRYVF